MCKTGFEKHSDLKTNNCQNNEKQNSPNNSDSDIENVDVKISDSDDSVWECDTNPSEIDSDESTVAYNDVNKDVQTTQTKLIQRNQCL